MKSISSAVEWLRARAENIVALLLGSMFLTFLIQIVFRYLLNLPLGWTIEYVTLVWLWGILFGYAFVVRSHEIIRLDIVYFAVPVGARRAMDVVSNLIVAGVMAWSLPMAFDYVTFMKIERTAFMRIPFDLVFSIYIPFVVAVIVRSLLAVVDAVRGKGYEDEPHSHAGEVENA